MSSFPISNDEADKIDLKRFIGNISSLRIEISSKDYQKEDPIRKQTAQTRLSGDENSKSTLTKMIRGNGGSDS